MKEDLEKLSREELLNLLKWEKLEKEDEKDEKKDEEQGKYINELIDILEIEYGIKIISYKKMILKEKLKLEKVQILDTILNEYRVKKKQMEENKKIEEKYSNIIAYYKSIVKLTIDLIENDEELHNNLLYVFTRFTKSNDYNHYIYSLIEKYTNDELGYIVKFKNYGDNMTTTFKKIEKIV